MADIYSFNADTGTIFIRALPGDDLTGWSLASYQHSGNSSAPVDQEPVDTMMPYGFEPDDGFVYYRQELGPLSSPSDQRDAIVLMDETQTPIDVAGWGKDDDFDLIGGPADGIPINPGDGTYAPGDGPWYTYGPPWETSPDPTEPPDGLQPLPPPCFVSGTMIMTPKGPVLIESIKRGQEITTLNGPKRVKWVGSTVVRLDSDEMKDFRPIRFMPSSLEEGVPKKEVLLSPQHRVFCQSSTNELLFGVSGVLVAAKHLINEKTIRIDSALKKVTYFHLLFEDHEIVTANGMYAESLLLGDWTVSASSIRAQVEFLKIFPNGLGTESSNSVSAHLVLKRREAGLLAVTGS